MSLMIWVRVAAYWEEERRGLVGVVDGGGGRWRGQ